MTLQLTILGSGTSVPVAHRRPSAFWLRDEQLSLLIDCGAGCTTTLAEHGGDLAGLDALILTHLHPDHTAELVPLLFAFHNPLGPRRVKPLQIWGPPGTADHLAALREAYGSWLEPRGWRPDVREIRAGATFAVANASITAQAVVHSGPAFAYRVVVGSKCIAFSGDTGPCPGLVAAARDADLFLCECAAQETEHSTTHMSPTAVAEVAAKARCAVVVLIHLYPWIVDSDPVARVQRHFDGQVLLGADGMRLIAAP